MKAAETIAAWVLAIHRRNGGSLTQLDFNQRLLDPALGLDSLDLAEIMVAVEKEFGRSPFDSPQPPQTWAELIAHIEGEESRHRSSREEVA